MISVQGRRAVFIFSFQSASSKTNADWLKKVGLRIPSFLKDITDNKPARKFSIFVMIRTIDTKVELYKVDPREFPPFSSAFLLRH
jgi:hypothetical protein